MDIDFKRVENFISNLSKEQLVELLMAVLEEVESHTEGRYQPMYLRAFYAGVHYKEAVIIDRICDIEETFRDIIKD